MKLGILSISILTAFTLSASADVLTEEQKNETIEKLHLMLKESLNKQKNAINSALSDLQKASADNNAAYDLYEKTIKKANFEDKDKKGKEWIDWRMQQKAKADNNDFRAALRYRYSWALISLQAGAEPEDTYNASSYAKKALSLLNTVIGDIDKIIAYKDMLSGDPMGGEFDVFYSVAHIKKQGWPTGLFPVTEIYEALVFPPLRENHDFAGLRKAWQQLIALAGKVEIAEQTWRNKQEGNGKKASDKDQNEAIHSLRWACEEDCYKHGDEVKAAQNMLLLIRSAPSPKTQAKAIQSLSDLLGKGTLDTDTAGK